VEVSKRLRVTSIELRMKLKARCWGRGEYSQVDIRKKEEEVSERYEKLLWRAGGQIRPAEYFAGAGAAS
jgi:hypothetical protein